MAQFVITPKSLVQFGSGLNPIRQGHENERLISVNVIGITPTTLFTRFNARSILADQLNRAYGTTGFTPDNVIKFAGQFYVRQL